MTTATFANDQLVDSTPSVAPRAALSRGRLWTGRIFSGLVAAFLLLDGVMKLLLVPQVLEGSAKVGFSADTVFSLGVVLVASVVLYVIPRTAFFGAILLTAYLGGAVATHVRLHDPLFSHTLFPVYFGILSWAGLALRDRRLEALVKAQKWDAP